MAQARGVARFRAGFEDDLCRFLRRLFRKKKSRPRARIVFYKAVIDKLTVVKGDLKSMIITDTQQFDVAIKPLDKKGKPAQVDGTPAWASSDPSIATVEASADGLSAVVKATDNLGAVQVSVKADADLGAGVRELIGVLDVEVVAGEAASLSIIAGTPVEQA